MDKRRRKSVLLLALVYMASGIPVLNADPEVFGGPNQHTPEISASSTPTSSGAPVGGDPTNDFFGITPLGGGDRLPPSDKPVTAGELKHIEDLWSEVQMLERDYFLGENESISQKENAVSKPVFFMNSLYAYVKKKAQKSFTESFEKTEVQITEKPEIDKPQDAGKKATFPGLPRELADKAVMEMKLEVTEQMVEANESIHLNEAHPFMDWLVMSDVPEENKQALAEAEAQRKAMAETVKEAEKNGNRVFFIVNGEIVPFFFNIPLFAKGDYQLYIVDETRPPASKPA